MRVAYQHATDWDSIIGVGARRGKIGGKLGGSSPNRRRS
jgi:hypothetical protein